MPQLEQDRRALPRFDMHLPAVVKLDEGVVDELLTETQNVSARGMFFYLDRPLAEGARIEISMTFPPHMTLTDSVRMRFFAHVVRVDKPLPASRIGVAAVIEKIEEYTFLQPPTASNNPGRMQ